MLVLIFAAGSFLIFIAVIACLFVAHTLERHEVTRKRNVWTQGPVRLLSITQAFEPTYAPLWEAPVAALRLVSFAKSGIPAHRLEPIFHRACCTFPEIYEGCEFMQWLQFLECEDLVCWDADGNKVTITETGREFLAHRFVSDALLEA